MNGDEHTAQPLAPDSGIELHESGGPHGNGEMDNGGEAPRTSEPPENRRRKPVSND